MATKAGLGFLARQLSSHSFFYGVWSNSFLAHCDIEAIDGWVEAHQTVVELAIAFEDPGLPTGAEAPPNGHGDRTGAVRDRVGALVADSFDRVGVRSLAKNHSWMRLQCGIGAGQFDCASHGRLRLSCRLHGVAVRAGRG